MPNNIQTIIDKFDEIKPLGLTPDDKLVHLEEGDKRVLKAYQQQIRLFLQSSLTSMLDGIEKIVSVKKQERSVLEHLYCDGTSNFEDGYNTCCQEVINIINSHR